MRASVLYVQCVAARIWKVKNVFDANRTGSMKPQDLAMGEDPVPLTLEQMRSRRVALLSNPGMAERERENGELPDNFSISQGQGTNRVRTMIKALWSRVLPLFRIQDQRDFVYSSSILHKN